MGCIGLMELKVLGCSGGVGGQLRTTTLLIDDDVLIDAGIIFGTGFAPFRGGPMHYVLNEGKDAIQQRLKSLRADADEGWDSVFES